MVGREKLPHARAFVPGGRVHPEVHDFALKTFPQLVPLRQESGGVSLGGFPHAVFAGQRVDPAQQMEPTGALAARADPRPLTTLGPPPSQFGRATLATFILKEHHPLVTEPQRLAEFF